MFKNLNACICRDGRNDLVLLKCLFPLELKLLQLLKASWRACSLMTRWFSSSCSPASVV